MTADLWGRGVAYALRRPEYLLNVASRNMSAFPDEPDHFVQWLRTRPEFESVSERELRERFIPREIFGDYLRSIVERYLESQSATTPVAAEFVRGEAVDIEPREAAYLVRLADGSALEADRVVLATGNELARPAARRRHARGSSSVGWQPVAGLGGTAATPGQDGSIGCPWDGADRGRRHHHSAGQGMDRKHRRGLAPRVVSARAFPRFRTRGLPGSGCEAPGPADRSLSQSPYVWCSARVHCDRV
jgi:hypothetical protein